MRPHHTLAAPSRSGLLRLLAAVLALLLSPLALAQTSVTIRPAASLDLDQAVSLGAIATIAGPDAERLSAITVSPKPAKPGLESLAIDMAQVRRALEDAKVNLGRVTLSGMACSVRSASTPAASPKSSADPKEKPPGRVVDLSGEPTVRKLIAIRLAALYGVLNDDLRLRFLSTNPEDDAFLDAPADAPKRVEIQPGASGLSGRAGVRVEIYLADRIVASRVVSIESQVRREGCVSTASIDRDAIVTAADLIPETRWLSPGADIPISIDQAIGLSARRRIEAGKPIVSDDVRPPIAVARGEEVSVRTLTGGMILTSKARALAAARDGELVELRRDGAKKSFFARMSGKGIAVVRLDDETALKDALEAEPARTPSAPAPRKIRRSETRKP